MSLGVAPTSGQSTPQTNAPNTAVIYINGIDDKAIGDTSVDTFMAAMFSSPTDVVLSDVLEVSFPVPYDCIVKNAAIRVNGSATTANAELILRVNNVVPTASTGVFITITAGQTGVFNSGETFLKLKKGDTLVWQLESLTTGVLGVQYISLELKGLV